MVKSKHGFVATDQDVKILDAWHGWKDGEPMPEILKPLISNRVSPNQPPPPPR